LKKSSRNFSSATRVIRWYGLYESHTLNLETSCRRCSPKATAFGGGSLLAIEKLEQNVTHRSLNSIGEPMLGKRGLYPTLGGAIRQQAATSAAVDTARADTDGNSFSIIYGNELDAILWLLFYLDGVLD
jgi:aminopeptidase-like protein